MQAAWNWSSLMPTGRTNATAIARRRSIADVTDSTNSFGRVAWFADGTRLVAGTDRGIEIITLGPPVQRRLILDNFAILAVDLSPDGANVAYGVNDGDAKLYVLSGF